MPKKPASLHPLLWQAVQEVVGTLSQPVFLSQESEEKRRVLRFTELRQKKIAAPALGGCLGGFALIVVGSIVASLEMFPFAALAWFGALGALSWMAWRVWAVRFASADELATVLPILHLTSTQRSVFEAWLALEDSALPEETRAELRTGLDRLLDEELRLETLSARGLGATARPETIEKERDSLQARLDGVADPAARETLAQAVRTSERRLASARNASAAMERIDAQRLLIGQAADDVRDGLLRAGTYPAMVGVETSSVREALAHVQAHATALEEAVAEVRALEA